MAYSDSRKEKRFLDALESLFTGAEVEGDSGFVNLMCIKRNYFRSIRSELIKNIYRRAEPDTAFREELFDKLDTFFHRYFCESGSIYFRHLPAFSKIYERVYEDGQDVALSWKTHALYYVKSDVLVRSMPVELRDADSLYSTQRFYFDASECAHKRNNERREFLYTFDKVKKEAGKRVICLKVAYTHSGKKTKTEDILRRVRKQNIHLSEDELQRAIAVFGKQTEVDFFINKDARGFLREQFNLWLYQYIFEGQSDFDAERINQLQAIKDTAYEIIDFIAQFEDELRRVWEKPKFVRNVNYVVTLDKLSDEVLRRIVKHKGAKTQVKDWHELGMVDDTFMMKQIFSDQGSLDDGNSVGSLYRFLPLDTKHFKELELDILDCLGDLDEVLDGELVHSENWQALNTLQRRYKEQVKCIYIDPPYNTNMSPIPYKNNYRHSSWMSLMQGGILLSKEYLNASGVFAVAIDDEEIYHLKCLIDNSVGANFYVGTICVQSNPGGRDINTHFATCHDYCVFYANPDQKDMVLPRDTEIAKEQINEFRRTGGYSSPEERPNSEFAFYYDAQSLAILGIGGKRSDPYPSRYSPASILCMDSKSNIVEMSADDFHVKNPQAREILPEFSNGGRGVWRWSNREKILRAIQRGDIFLRRERNSNITVKLRSFTKPEYKVKTIWSDSKYSATTYGTMLLQKLFGSKSHFSYPKSIHAVQTSINVATYQTDGAFILDYFAGSGTTAHAVINLNREDGGNRKYLLIEMGEYFHTVLLPRIKKLIYSKDWKEGKPVSCEGSSHCLKYYSLEQYEHTLSNARYADSEQLELDSAKSPFAHYVFFRDDKLSHIVGALKSGKLKINLKSLYPDIDIAESLANILGKQIRRRTANSVVFSDGSAEKINPTQMNKEEQIHFVSLLRPYLWWGGE